MNNIKSYDEFVNEEFNLDNLKRFKNRVKLELSLFTAQSFIKVLKVIFFFLKDFKKYMNDYSEDLDTIRYILIFINKYEPKLSRLLETDDEGKIKEQIETMCTDYEYTFERSFLDDLKEILSKYGIKNPKDEKAQKRVNNLLKILNGINQHVEVDPYGEEEWEEDSKDKNFKTKTYDIMAGTGLFGLGDNYLKYIKDNLIGKKISFVEYGREYRKLKFRKVIKVADVKFDRLTPSKLILIDDEGDEHTYLNTSSNAEENPIKILN